MLARFKKMKARIDPVVCEGWVNMLNGLYGLIKDNGDVFKKALRK